MRISAVGVIYLVVGAIVAATHDYFEHINTLKQFLSAVLAVVLWPFDPDRDQPPHPLATPEPGAIFEP